MLSNVVENSSETGSITWSSPKFRTQIVSMKVGPSSSTNRVRRKLSLWSAMVWPLAVER